MGNRLREILTLAAMIAALAMSPVAAAATMAPSDPRVGRISPAELSVAESTFASQLMVLRRTSSPANWPNSRSQLFEAESLLSVRVSTGPASPGETSLLVSMWLDTLSGTQLNIGQERWPAALTNARRAIEIQEQLLGLDEPRRYGPLVKACRAAVNLGEIHFALAYSEEAVRLMEAQPRPDTLSLARAINLLGRAQEIDGSLADALVSYDQAAGLLQTPVIRDTLELFSAWNNAGLLLISLNDFEGARGVYEFAGSLVRGDSLKWHKQARKVDSNLAIVDAETGHFERARAQFERRLEEVQDETGPRSLDSARWFNNLSVLERIHGDRLRSKILGEHALGIRREIADWGGIVESLRNLGLTWQALGVPDSAIACFDEALARASQRMSRGNPGLIPLLLPASRARMAEGSEPEAFESAARAESLGLEQLDLGLKVLSERQGLEFALGRDSGLDVLTTIAAASGESSLILAAWDATLRSRTLVLDEMAFRQVFAAFAGSDSARALRDSLQVARQRLLDALRVSDADPVAQEATVMRARQSLEQAERRLARVSTVYQRERSYDQIGIREVAAALPSDARLVAFSRYRQYRRVPSVITISGQALHGALLDTMSAYVAFVLDGSSHSVHAISLGSAGEIDSLVASWRQAAESPPRSAGRSKATEQACRMTGWALRRRVWDPLADFGGGANRAFVVPDGALLLVNFAALPAKRDSFLAETGPLIHVLSAERDLARRPSARDLDGELLVMGDPVFPLPRTAPGGNPGVPRWDPAPGAAARGPVPCFDPNTAFFASLPGSAEEVRDVAALWRDPGARSRTRGRVARVYLGREATKRNFLESAAHARVIHLATHAYSISEACTTYVVRPGGPGRPPVQSAVVHSDVPLLRSGIVFAGDAGSSPPGGPRAGRDDFVVTAQEIAGLDLSGVDWAVVSACDAGLGVFRPGEGLFGLRRAFQIAGARTTIMGLWKVDDAATQAWMRELYRARLTDRLQTAEAVREADRTILRTRRARGLSVHPAFWASFIATGDWR